MNNPSRIIGPSDGRVPYQERFTFADANTMTYEVTIDDPTCSRGH